jgi:L-amino acid N-acyltransferase YncA
LIARDGEQIVGRIALSPVSSRRVYAGVAEVSVYVAAEAQGRGGKLLMQSLIERSENCSIWTLQAGIFPEKLRALPCTNLADFAKSDFDKKLANATVLGGTFAFSNAAAHRSVSKP